MILLICGMAVTYIHNVPSKHSGAKPAHELVVEAVAKLARSAGFPSKTRNATVARGRERGDVEFQRLHVAGKADLVIDHDHRSKKNER